jgi:hypothetical protein
MVIMTSAASRHRDAATLPIRPAITIRPRNIDKPLPATPAEGEI